MRSLVTASRKKFVAVAMAVALLCSGSRIMADPALYVAIDSATVSSPGPVLLLVDAWAAGVGVQGIAMFYIDDVYVTAGIPTERTDVCAAFHNQTLACGDDQVRPCFSYTGLVQTSSCVGSLQSMNITGYSSGQHVVKVCMLHATTTTSTPYRACSAGTTFTRP